MPTAAAVLAPGLWLLEQITENLRISTPRHAQDVIHFQVPTGECSEG